MDTRCKACLQPATRKCTRCGEVFCDLHVRYGGEIGSMYGGVGDVGTYCDTCWAARMRGQKRRTVLVGLGVLLLVVNLLGFAWLRGTKLGSAAWIVVGMAVLAAVCVSVVSVVRRD